MHAQFAHPICLAAAAVALAAGRRGSKSVPFGWGKRCEYEHEQVVRQLKEMRLVASVQVAGDSGSETRAADITLRVRFGPVAGKTSSWYCG